MYKKLYFKIYKRWEQWKYNKECNTQYYREICDRLNDKVQKQTVEIYDLQNRLHKCEDLMTGLSGISEGLYRCRNDIAYLISYKSEKGYCYDEIKLDFVLHQLLPVFKSKATIAECRLCPSIESSTNLIFHLDYISTEYTCRNQGLGGEMVRYIEEIAKKFNASVIVGDIKQSEENEYGSRIKFYRNLGYDILEAYGNNTIRKELKDYKD